MLSKEIQTSVEKGEMLPLMEEFYTIQGEGYHTGTAAYFVRIGGCDVGCHWCDVKESWNAALHPPTHINKIVENAIKYSPDVPKIDVFTENVKEMVIIKVKDNGLGMGKTAQKRIFEKFYREHTGDLHNVKGHGLGLAYVKRIVEDHNGQVYVESEKGKGSTFIIKLPLIN